MGEWGRGREVRGSEETVERVRWSMGDAGFAVVAPSPIPRFAVLALLTSLRPGFEALRNLERSPRSSVAVLFPGRRLRGWMICNGPY